MLTSDAPAPRTPLGQWLVENVPRGANLEAPDRRSNREIPFHCGTGEYAADRA